MENGSTLSGGFSEENLKNYTDLVAEVTENTNGLKQLPKMRTEVFVCCESKQWNGFRNQGRCIKTAENITTTVKRQTVLTENFFVSI